MDGHLFHIEEHLNRIEASSKWLWNAKPNLKHLEAELNALPKEGLQKCKVFYNQESYCIDCQVYKKRELQHLYLVHDYTIKYSVKYTDRHCFLKHTNLLSNKKDILIVQHERLTDASYANIILWNGKEWHTPSNPLLLGIKRKTLLKEKVIQERNIHWKELDKYEKIGLINAMLDIGDAELSIESIRTMDS